MRVFRGGEKKDDRSDEEDEDEKDEVDDKRRLKEKGEMEGEKQRKVEVNGEVVDSAVKENRSPAVNGGVRRRA